MNGQIVIFLRLLAIALTITGSVADGESTANAVAVSKPVTVSNPAKPSKLNLTEDDTDTADLFGFTCYNYTCGEKVIVGSKTVKRECKDKPDETAYKICNTGIEYCKKTEVQGYSVRWRYHVDQVIRGCADEILQLGSVDDNFEFLGSIKTYTCGVDLCNGSSVLSSIAFVTLAALIIAANIF